MRRLTLTVIALGAIAMPELAFADVAVPLHWYTLPAILPIVVLETLVMLLLVRRWLHSSVGLWRILAMTGLANLLTSLVGTAILMPSSGVAFPMLAFAFGLSFALEWIVYLAFFYRQSVRASHCLLLSLAANTASYALVVLPVCVLGWWRSVG